MNIEKANIIDTDEVFIMSYKLNVYNTETNERAELDPILVASPKHPGLETKFFCRNQTNRIPVTVFI